MSSAKILVQIHLAEDLTMRSEHKPLGPEDEKMLASWPSGGLVQIAHGLFVETMRKESYTMAISLLSQGTEEKDLTAPAIEEKVRAHFLMMLDHFATAAAEEALARVVAVDSTRNPS